MRKNNLITNSDTMHITMPENITTFENLAPILYQALFEIFSNKGYLVSTNIKNSNFILKSKINKLVFTEKFISPDLLLYNQRVLLEVIFRLYDYNNKLLKEKLFSDSLIISYPSDPLYYSNFLVYKYTELIKRLSKRVEFYFRKYLLKK